MTVTNREVEDAFKTALRASRDAQDYCRSDIGGKMQRLADEAWQRYYDLRERDWMEAEAERLAEEINTVHTGHVYILESE